MKRFFVVFTATMLVLGLVAGPVGAAVQGLAAFNGQARVGKMMPDGCPKSGASVPTGKGLGLGVIVDPDTGTVEQDVPKNYGYWLRTNFNFLGTNNAQVPGLYAGVFEVCGYLTTPAENPVAKATCLSTKGHHGRGQAFGIKVDDATQRFDLKVYNLNWKAAATGLLIITGNYQVYHPGTKTKKGKDTGTILAVVGVGPDVADPAEDPIGCLRNNAKRFLVTGAAALVQDDEERPKDETKKCPKGVPDSQCGPGDNKA